MVNDAVAIILFKVVGIFLCEIKEVSLKTQAVAIIQTQRWAAVMGSLGLQS
jgi:hypothetical protein